MEIDRRIENRNISLLICPDSGRFRQHYSALLRKLVSITIGTLTVCAIFVQAAYAGGTILCDFNGKNAKITVTNNNKFQSTCSWSCIYKTDDIDFLAKGKTGLNSNQSFISNVQSKNTIESVSSSAVTCE